MTDAVAQRSGCSGRCLWPLLLAGLLAHACATAAQTPPWPDGASPVPGIPWAQDIDSLDPVALRRQISRAEGRISDLTKTRTAALAGLEAAVTRAEARAAARAAPTAAHLRDTNAAAPTATRAIPPARQSPTRDARRRAIREHYDAQLAAARHELGRLLARQARIDPQAPDQDRLRSAVGAHLRGLRSSP